MSNGTQNYEEITLSDKTARHIPVRMDKRSGSELPNIFVVSEKMFMST